MSASSNSDHFYQFTSISHAPLKIEMPHHYHAVNETEELSENHDTISNEIMFLIFLIVVANWISTYLTKACRIETKSRRQRHSRITLSNNKLSPRANSKFGSSASSASSVSDTESNRSEDLGEYKMT